MSLRLNVLALRLRKSHQLASCEQLCSQRAINAGICYSELSFNRLSLFYSSALHHLEYLSATFRTDVCRHSESKVNIHPHANLITMNNKVRVKKKSDYKFALVTETKIFWHDPISFLIALMSAQKEMRTCLLYRRKKESENSSGFMLENQVGVIISIRVKLYPAVSVRKKTCRSTVKKVEVTDLKSNKYVFDSVLNQTKGAPQKTEIFSHKFLQLFNSK